uniref:Heat shock protein 70 n=1 Tax=Panagrolaimus sp. ES5 TaxID=591445 RepID=A0AC34FS10_9BILA
MTIVAGCDPNSGLLSLHNFTTDKNYTLKVSSIGNNDEIKINELFDEIQSKFGDKIDNLYVYLDYSYKNEFRKKFISVAKSRNIDNIEIMSSRQSKLIGGLTNLLKDPQHGNMFWIFEIGEFEIFCNIWEFDEINGWKFKDSCCQEKTFEENIVDPVSTDLHKIKSKIKYENNEITPFINVFCVESTVAEAEFISMFPKYKYIVFHKVFEPEIWLKNYGIKLAKGKNLNWYKTDAVLERSLEIREDYEMICEIPNLTILPSSATAFTSGNESLLEIYEDGNCATVLPLDKPMCITLSVDQNGIYTENLNSMEDNFGVDESLNSKEVVHNQYHHETTPSLKNPSNIQLVIPEATKPECQSKKLSYDIPVKPTNYDPDLDVVGIDLGTTECCAAIIRQYGPDFPVLDEISGSRTMPSYVAFNEEMPLCGKIVVDRMRNYANYSVYDSKRIIGKRFDEIKIDPLWPFYITETSDKNVVTEVETFEGTENKYPEEISAVLLSHIKKTTETFKRSVLEEVVITIPSKFSETEKEATKTAAEMAGWKTIHFIPEPVAAAFAYFMEIDIPNQSNILICDCGGGTTDICVAKVSDQKLEILNYDGDLYLGGRDFDELLFNHFSDILANQYGIDLSQEGKTYLLKQKCQDLKHTLSVATEVLLDVNDYDANIVATLSIEREEFTAMADELLTRMKTVIRLAVNNSNLQFDQINYVFLVGGSSKMPMTKELLSEIFPYANHQCNLYTDWVVAHGAALYGYHLKSLQVPQ